MPVFEYIALFERYVRLNPALARQEFEAWRQGGDPVFGRLRVWACRLPGFLDDRAASEILAGVHDIVFWGSRDQRDVLLALRDLWNCMSSDVKARVEDRIIKVLPPNRRLSAADNRKHKAWAVHERIEWLRQGGCAISKKLDRRAQRLAALLPEAAKEGAVHAADLQDSRGGFVITDKSFGDVDAVPIVDLISWAIEGRGRTWGVLKEFDPLAGLSERRPVRLLAALRWNTLQGKDVNSAWRDFLLRAMRAERTSRGSQCSSPGGSPHYLWLGLCGRQAIGSKARTSFSLNETAKLLGSSPANWSTHLLPSPRPRAPERRV